jgi:phosphate/sulfate permease
MLIDDIHNLRRFRSVQVSAIGGAAALALAAYGTAQAIGLHVVSSIPHWILTTLVGITMATPFATVIARAVKQPDLPKAKP